MRRANSEPGEGARRGRILSRLSPSPAASLALGVTLSRKGRGKAPLSGNEKVGAAPRPFIHPGNPMAYSFDELAERERRRWMKPNAHLWVCPDAHRFMRPDAARFIPLGAKGWRHPDEKLWNFVAAHYGRTIAMYARGTGANLSIAPELARLQAEQDAIRERVKAWRTEHAQKRARGREEAERLKRKSDAAWEKFIAAFDRHWDACRKAGFNPAQPRVPAGNPDGGQWTSGGAGGGNTGGGITDPRVLSDATPDNEWIPGARYAQRRSGGGSSFGGLTPGQAARLSAIEARAQEAIRRVREVDPEWKPPPSIYETVEGLIRAREADAEQAQARFLELQRNGIGPGPFAGESIPARGPERDFTAAERREINRIGSETGCHTCGTLDPGTRTGNFIPDHQPRNALNSTARAQRLYPQCTSCSRHQGYWIGRQRGLR